MNRFLWGIAAMALFLSCSGEKTIDPNVEKLGRATGPAMKEMPGMPPPGMGQPAQGLEDSAEKPLHTGVASEIINVPNYTYIKIRAKGGEEIWSAVPKSTVKEGADVSVRQSLVMNDFTSPSLGRTFDSVIFGVLEDGSEKDFATVDAGVQSPPPNSKKMELPEGHPPID